MHSVCCLQSYSMDGVRKKQERHVLAVAVVDIYDDK